MIGPLNQESIRKACGEAATQRGRNYFESGKVLKTEIKQYTDNLVIHGSVSGSAGRVYSQAIAIAGLEKKSLAIQGLCSCPMMLNCKHVAATLIHLMESQAPSVPAQVNEKVDRWIETLKQAIRPNRPGQPAQDREPNRHCLVYVLAIESHIGGPKLTVSSHKVRFLNRGGYGKPQAYPLERTNVGYNDGLIRPVDQEIARLLVNPKVYYYNNANRYHLEGEFGEIALRKMVACKRCFWESADLPPLILGQARKIEFRWESADDGRRLMARIDPPTDRLVRLDSLWYIDPGIAEIGVLHHEYLSGGQISALLSAPSIPADRLPEISRRLLIDLPEYRLEPPVKLDIEEVQIEGRKPIPRLCLKSREDPPPGVGPGRFHYALLTFDYGSVHVGDFADSEISRVVQGNTLYTIHRQVADEIAAMNRLRERGMALPTSGDTQSRTTLEWLFPAHTLADSAIQWHDFLESALPELRECGWQIEIDETFVLRFDEVDKWHAELDAQENSEWFSLALGVEVDGEHINLLPILVDILSQSRDTRKIRENLEERSDFWVPLEGHRWLKIPSQRLAPIFDTLVELYDREALDGRGNLSLSRHQGIQIGDLLNDPSIRWRGAEELKRLSERLRNFHGIEKVLPPDRFNTELRPYQLQGLAWMQFLRGFDFNAILADDMGLGKTVQTLAHLLLEKQLGRMETPSLIIAPTSLMGNWRREAQRFAPDLKLLVLHGAERHDQFEEIGAQDVVLTTYPLLRRDREHLLKHHFHYVILDEAQTVKNPKSQTTRLVYELKCRHKLCLTGTPMENHLGELWSMFHFLMPGFLGTLERFNRLFRNPVEKQGDATRQLQLAKRIAPFLLRRTKQEVAAELPEKTEIIRSVALEGKQRDLYEVIRLAMDRKVREEIRKKGVARSHIMILDALLKLRQVCCDPRLVSLEQARKVQQSAKMDLLLDILPEMVEEGRRILLFSQFVKMLELIEPELSKRGIGYVKLTGGTRKRDEAIDAFQNGQVPVFLISLKAGGVGLNLTAADTVIHYDPWWNPAAENQATDRAHRIGQQNAVFVYKLVTEETVEEKILALQQKKQALADAVYSGKKGDSAGLFSADDLTDLLKPLE